MARVPLTKEEVAPTRLVLNVENVGLTEEQFSQLCSDNRDLRMELTAQKELIVMSPAGLKSGWRELALAAELMNWARKDGSGVAFGPSTGYKLPNGAIREPNASWIRRQRLAGFTDAELEQFGQLCPDFVAEIISQSDTPDETRLKMDEYRANGAQLGWLIDPFERRVYIYRPRQAVECLENPITISGDPALSGFVFNVAEIWQMHITERYHPRDFGHMDLESTFDDPKYYTRPFTLKTGLGLMPDSDLIENVCNENEKDRVHLGR